MILIFSKVAELFFVFFLLLPECQFLPAFSTIISSFPSLKQPQKNLKSAQFIRHAQH